MLHNDDPKHLGRYKLLQLIQEQRRKCNIEIFLRKLEDGSICADKKPYPRYLYLQDLQNYISKYNNNFPTEQLNQISISACTGELPREFERISIQEAIDGAMDKLGLLDRKHLTLTFILSLGVCFTAREVEMLKQTEAEGSLLERAHSYLHLPASVKLKSNATGLTLSQFRAMYILKSQKYSALTTEQLTTLRNIVLYRLEGLVKKHIAFWERKKDEIDGVLFERANTKKNEVAEKESNNGDRQ